MTPLMLKALSAAEEADHCGGLKWSRAGWVTDKSSHEYHNSASVRALQDRGALKEWGKGKNRYFCITPHGEALLAEARGDRS